MATQANLIATYQSNPTLQNRYTQQEYLDMFGFGAQQPTPDPDPTPTPPPPDGIQNIIGQNLNQGGGGGGGIQSLQQTFTPGAQPRGPKTNFNINPAAQLTGKGRLDPMGSDVDYFNAYGNDPRRFDFGFTTSSIPGQEGYQAPSKYFEEPSLMNKGITAVKDFFSGIGTSKVRGTLGTRLANAPRLPLPASIMAYSRSPLNPASKQFNPAFEGQLNYLEGQDNFIGRDQQSGGLKYGPESVLSGQNVISGFGTNDYLGQLDKYETKVTDRYGKIVDKYGEDSEKAINYKFKFVDKVKKEKQKFIDSTIYKAQEEQRKKEEKAAAAKAKQAAFDQARSDRDQAIASGLDAAIREGRDTSGFDRPSSGAYAEEAGMGVDGGYASDFGFADGGRVYLYNRLK